MSKREELQELIYDAWESICWAEPETEDMAEYVYVYARLCEELERCE